MMDFLKMIVTFWILPETGSKLFSLLLVIFLGSSHALGSIDVLHFGVCGWNSHSFFASPFAG